MAAEGDSAQRTSSPCITVVLATAFGGIGVLIWYLLGWIIGKFTLDAFPREWSIWLFIAAVASGVVVAILEYIRPPDEDLKSGVLLFVIFPLVGFLTFGVATADAVLTYFDHPFGPLGVYSVSDAAFDVAGDVCEASKQGQDEDSIVGAFRDLGFEEGYARNVVAEALRWHCWYRNPF